MKPFYLIFLLSSFTLTQAHAINPIDQNPIKKSQSKAKTPLSKLSKSDSILFQFLKLYVKDTAVKKVLLISGDQLKLNDSLIHFVNSNKFILILNERFYNPNVHIDYGDSFYNQTLPCNVLWYSEKANDTVISYGRSNIILGFATIGLSGYVDDKTYIWNKTTKTFSIKE